MAKKRNSQEEISSDNLVDYSQYDMTPEQRQILESYDKGKKNKKKAKKSARRSKFKEKLDMYEMIIANLIAGNSLIEPTTKLDNSQIAIGFSNISSEEQITKYFMLSKFPDYLKPRLIDNIRNRCINNGVKINFYFYADPHMIDWDSPEMRNRMAIWRQYSQENSGPIDVFSYKTDRKVSLARQRIMVSTQYLNEAEDVHKRTFIKTYFIIEVSAHRDDDSLVAMLDSIRSLKYMCAQDDIKLHELRINLIDWLRAISPFSLKSPKEVADKISRKVLTDDLLANFNSYKQGRIGISGVPLGIDVLLGGPVMRVFKEDPDGADNWLISAETGGGKSYWVKTLLTYLLASGFVCCVMDYEGDEYSNLANFIKAENPDDVRIVSMGKGSTVYFDPCEIPTLTGDDEVDADLKSSAIDFTLSIFRIIVHGLDGEFTRPEERIMSRAIQRMYDTAGVTEDKQTWKLSKGLRLQDVYLEVKEMVESKELVDFDDDNKKHKAATAIVDAASIYFEPGEARSNTFKQPMSANELYRAKLIVFSFGMRGAGESAIDKTSLALKQLCVAYVNIQVSNYCKYVRKCFNVKVWEEFQRWGRAQGSAETILNAITGGRKRGDVNFIITNDLAAMMDESNKLCQSLHQNIQNYAIGKINAKGVREKFCDQFDLKEIKGALNTIAKAHATIKSGNEKLSGTENKYQNAFCVVLDNGKKAIVKAKLPAAIAKSKLFKTGVDIKNNND